MVNSPRLSLTASRFTPDASDSTSTCAPGMRARVKSLTVPTMAPSGDWAKTQQLTSAKKSHTRIVENVRSATVEANLAKEFKHVDIPRSPEDPSAFVPLSFQAPAEAAQSKVCQP